MTKNKKYILHNYLDHTDVYYSQYTYISETKFHTEFFLTMWNILISPIIRNSEFYKVFYKITKNTELVNIKPLFLGDI